MLLVYRGHSRTVTGIAWSPDSTHIASVSLDATSQVWDAQSGKLRFSYHNHNAVSAIYSVAWSPHSTRIAIGDGDGVTQVWNVNSGKRQLTYDPTNASAVLSVAWSPDGTRIASTSDATMVQV